MAARTRQPARLGVWCLIVWSITLSPAWSSQQEGDRASIGSRGAGGPACARVCPTSAAELPPPNDPGYWQMGSDLPLQWPLHALEAVSAWGIYPGAYYDAATRPADSPIVALIDSGIDPGHPDFPNPGASAAEATEGGQLLLSASRTFRSWEGEPEQGAVDEHGHGTHLAGIIAAAANNGETAGGGMAGLGYPLRLLPLRVTDESGAATHADMAAAITYAADQGASVIVIGPAGPTWSQGLQEAVDYAWERGCLLVAPAGDTGVEQPMFPAACPHVLGVAPTAADGWPAWYGTRGEHVALAAPGGDETAGIYSTLPTYACALRSDLSGPAYGRLMGSGQAAAHVGAAAGLWLALHPDECHAGRANRALWQALQESACAVGEESVGWKAEMGYGLVSPRALLAGERRKGIATGSLVGRVMSEAGPVLGASVQAICGEEAPTALTRWPAGGYRLANVPAGVYTVSVSAGGHSGVWEGAVVRPGCDTPSIDFHLGSAPANSALLQASVPEAVVCGRQAALSLTFRNTGAGAWRRREGHCLRHVGDAEAVDPEASQWELPPGAEIVPGQPCAFSFDWRAPDRYGFYHLVFQMCQQGGCGRFGEVAERTVSVSSFLDVRPDHWAVAAVEAVKAAGIVQGYPGDLYCPSEAVTRAQMAVYLARALAGGEASVPQGPETPTFPDVPGDHWAFRYVEYCHVQAVVQGYADGYHPEEAVDRGQMAVFVARAICGGEEYVPDPGCSEPVFPDVACEFWARKHIQFIKAAGVTSGYPDGLYHPEAVVTRDQMAVYVQRALALPL